MHPMMKCIKRTNNEAIPQLHKVIHIEGHLRVQPPWWGYLGHMYTLHVDVLFGYLVQLLLGRQEMTMGIKRVSKWEEAVHHNAHTLSDTCNFCKQAMITPRGTGYGFVLQGAVDKIRVPSNYHNNLEIIALSASISPYNQIFGHLTLILQK
jgi:hypothetical protein